MRFEVTGQKFFNGTYYTFDEYKKMRLGMFEQAAQVYKDPATFKEQYIPKRYYIILVLKDGDKFEQIAWLSPAVGLTSAKAFKMFLKSVNTKNNTITQSFDDFGTEKRPVKQLHFDAFMPRTEVPEQYKKHIKHI